MYSTMTVSTIEHSVDLQYIKFAQIKEVAYGGSYTWKIIRIDNLRIFIFHFICPKFKLLKAQKPYKREDKKMF